MASAKATISGLGALDRLDRRTLIQKAEVVLEDALEQGERAMKDAIATRGTGKTWKFPSFDTKRAGSFPGRVDRGDMQGDVRGIITDRSANRVEGSLGWDDDSPFYYRLQEAGFMHRISGQEVEGMRALRDSAELAKRVLISGLEDIAKDL